MIRATITALVLGVAVLATPGGSTPDAPLDATTLPTPPANGEMGFVLTAFAPAIYQGAGDCPDGLAGTVRENYLQTLGPAEKERLSQPAHEAELSQRWKAWTFGPDNTNICGYPERFPDRGPQKMLQGPIAYGLDLDGGAAASGGCAHESFTTPEGATGIDNQVYRAMGCTRNYRGVDGIAGDVVDGSNRLLASGEHSLVLRLRGVDSLVEDTAVEVVFATTEDQPILDSQQQFITGASYGVAGNPRWRNRLRGQIRNGVLTTDPTNLRLKRTLGHGGIRGQKAEWDLRRAQLKLSFARDGSLRGLMGAYQTPSNVIISTVTGGYGAAVAAGMDCAAQYNTLRLLADGDRDPASGKCTTVSAAFDIAAVPAFVNDREAGQ